MKILYLPESKDAGVPFYRQYQLMEYLKSKGHGFGAEVKRRIMIGTYALSSGYYDAYYKRAQEVRQLIKQDFAKAFDPSADGFEKVRQVWLRYAGGARSAILVYARVRQRHR